jgi:carboxymethylenebutenolidase
MSRISEAYAMQIQTSNVELKANGGTVKAYFAGPKDGGPGILLLHAWWGLKPFFKQVCDRLAGEGFIVLAPDLRNGQIAQTVAEAEELMQKSDNHVTGEIVGAATQYLLFLPERKGAKIGVIGFSMGAFWALTVASDAPDRVAATVLFYGSGAADLGKIQSRVLGHYSDVDEWEPYDEIQQMEGNMKAAGVDVEFHTYPGMAHWFVEEDRPEYNAEAADLAWRRTLEFLKKTL